MVRRTDEEQDRVDAQRAERRAAGKKSWVLQGQFFQARHGGVRVANFSFAGAIWENIPRHGLLNGRMVDAFGQSTISPVVITKEKLAFVKRYDNRADRIVYVFKQRDGDSWVGTYDGPLTGKGVARAWLLEIPEDDLYPEPLYNTLGVTPEELIDAPPRTLEDLILMAGLIT